MFQVQFRPTSGLWFPLFGPTGLSTASGQAKALRERAPEMEVRLALSDTRRIDRRV